MVGTGPILRRGVLLPRRNSTGVPHHNCHNKGKVVIRVGKISPPQTGTRGSRLAHCTRRLVSVAALIASLTALALIVHGNRDRNWLAHALNDVSRETTQNAEGSAAVSPAEDRRYRALADFVARRYRVSQDMAYDLVHLAHSTGHQLGLDPLLIIAVIAIESRFNPIAESINGAKGLMQIIPKYHTAKLEEYGGEKAVFDPVANVKVGSRILHEYIGLTGNLGIALQMYAGALDDGEDQYTVKVMNEQQRLRRALPPAAAHGAFTRTAATSSSATRPLE